MSHTMGHGDGTRFALGTKRARIGGMGPAVEHSMDRLDREDAKDFAMVIVALLACGLMIALAVATLWN